MLKENVFDKISRQYYDLTVSEKKTADYVVAHRQEAQFMSIGELAEASDVAEATVSRFCRTLGYKGYNVFKLAIANSIGNNRRDARPLSGLIEESDSLEDVCRKLYAADTDAMAQTLELLDAAAVKKAADICEASDKVFCMGQGGSMLVASEAANVFATVSNKFFAVSDSHLQAIAAANMTENEAILFFSYSGATKDLMETLAVARERGGKVILVTRYPKSPGTALADVVLQCGSNESPLQLGSVAAKIAQLYLIDVLFSEVCRRDLNKCIESRERIAAALAEKHL